MAVEHLVMEIGEYGYRKQAVTKIMYSIYNNNTVRTFDYFFIS